jgi:Leucine-rich repeat (LRR) protein
MEENLIKNLNGFKSLINLNALYLGCNRISDATEIEKLSCLINLKELIMSFNPISRKSIYRFIIFFFKN